MAKEAVSNIVGNDRLAPFRNIKMQKIHLALATKCNACYKNLRYKKFIFELK